MFSRLAEKASRLGARAGNQKSLFGYSLVGGLVGAGTLATSTVVFADDHIHPPHNHWHHASYLHSYDHTSIRRGYEVYRQVCSTCHSMNLVHFRELVGVSHTEVQAKALAESIEITNEEANDEGEMFERKGKLSDAFPSPYANEQLARYANGGALPPDMSCLSKGRHNGPDYIFALLTGYKDSPDGIELRDGLHYNPYFPGGAIGMAPPLMDEGVEYEDGTIATKSQQAKDVAEFLMWCSEPEHDERKKTGMKVMMTLAFLACTTGYYKRFKWSILKSRRISWID